MERSGCPKYMILFFLLPALVYAQQSQQIQLTPEQRQALAESVLLANQLSNSNNTSFEQVKAVATTILTNPLIAGLIAQYGLADTQLVDGATLLIAGANNGILPLVQTALNAGAFINLRDENGWTALLWATRQNHTEVALYLLANGADPTIPNTQYGDTPLIWAAVNGNLEIAKALVQAGADVKWSDLDGDTPVLIAASRGYTELVKYLIEKGADVNAQNRNGRTALMWAANNGHIKDVQTLLEAGADPDLKASYYGDTALIYAITNGYNRVVRELIVGGADINLANNLGLTPLTNAAKNNRSEDARLLLSAGVDIDRQAEDGDTALMEAVKLSYTAVVRVFLEHCPNLNIVNNNRMTVQKLALFRQVTEIKDMIAAHPNLRCIHDNIVYSVGQTRYDVCREVKCCQGAWSPTGKTLETCGKQCRKILAPAGVCTLISNCPRLAQSLEVIIATSSNSFQSGNEFVSSYGCGLTSDRDVRVCCPNV